MAFPLYYYITAVTLTEQRTVNKRALTSSCTKGGCLGFPQTRANLSNWHMKRKMNEKEKN